MNDLYAQLISAAHSGAFGKNGSPEPSLANLNAGNYKKGRVTIQDLPIAIETPQGHRRTGKANGEPWSVICMAHYGYLVGSKASDGDAIDVYVGPVPESQSVFVVNQSSATGAFDEVKVMIGFLDEESARTAYMNSYERGWQGLGSMVGATMEQFKWWLKFGNTTLPFSTRALPYDGNDEMNQIIWDSAANPVGIEVADLIYRLRKDDGEGLLLDAVTASEILEDSDGEEVLDALVVQYAKAERKAAQLNKVMEANSGSVKPVSVQVTPPFKQKGTTNVVMLFELSDGQTVSIFLHNPDSTPNKILPADELVSWKWLLNKKDITVVVAPENGQDLNPREVARRIMRLAEKNSARFAQANKGRADRMAAIEQLKGDVSGKEATLAALDEQFRDLSDKVEAKRNAPAPASLQTNDQPEPTEPGPVTIVNPADPGIAAVTQTNDQPDQPNSTGDTLVAATVEPEPALVQEQATAVTIEQVADVMKRWNSDVLYAQVDANAEAASIMAAAQTNGWVSRRSTTQVDWTQEGVDALKDARASTTLTVADEPQAQADISRATIPEKTEQGDMTFSKMILISGITSGMETQLDELIKAKRLPEANVDAAKARVSELGEWLNAKPDEYFPEAAVGNTEAYNIFEKQVVVEFEAQRRQDAESAKGADPAATGELPAKADTTGDDTEQAAAKQFLQSVIDGNVDYMDSELATRLEQIHDQYVDNDEVMALFNDAAEAYSNFMVRQARNALT